MPDDDFFLAEEEYDFLADELFEDDVDVLAGILRVFPARIASLLMPLAFLIASTDTPYFFDIDDSVSPFLIECSVAFAGWVVVFFDADCWVLEADCVDLVEEAGLDA